MESKSGLFSCIADYVINTYYDIRNSFINEYNKIIRWFQYKKVLDNVYDFDWSSVLIVEQYQLKRLRDTISKYQQHVNWKHDVRRIDLAINLLDIVIDEGYNFSKDKYVNLRNGSRFIDLKSLELMKDCHPLQHELHFMKAFYIYNELRYNYLWNWWD